LTQYSYEYYRARRFVGRRTPNTDRLYDELVRSRRRIPSSSPDSPTQRVGAPAVGRFQKVEHLSPMGSLEKVTTDEALRSGPTTFRKRLRDEPVAYVLETEDRRLAINLVYEDGAFVARRDARRRPSRRGRDAEPADDPAIPLRMRLATASAAACSRSAARCTCRSRASARFNERLAEQGKKAAPNPRNAAAGSLRQKDSASRARPLSIWVYGAGVREGLDFGRRTRIARVAARARLPHESVRRTPGDDRRGRGSAAASGSARASSSTTRSTGS
jgi:DNA ligase (NAD+)